MTKKQTSANFSEELLSSWMNVAASFWSNTADQAKGNTNPWAGGNTESGANKDFPKDKNFEPWQMGYNNLTSLLKLMAHPENHESATNGTGNLYEMLMQMSGDSSENIMEFQSLLLKKLSAIGQQTKAYNYEDVDENMFDSFRTLYEQEFQKYFHIPQFGLPRFHQERVLDLMDKFNLFQFNMAELSYLFSVPLDKTNRVMQENMEKIINQGNFFDTPDNGYAEWVKTLEGHYMVLLKSEKYTQVLRNTIGSMAEYRNARDDVLCQVLKLLPIPTNRDMDEVYKELYTLKKQLKELSKKIDQPTKN